MLLCSTSNTLICACAFAALPRTMSQLKALTKLAVGNNKLPSTEVDFIIESFPQLTTLSLSGLGLTGEHLRVVPIVR